MECIDFEVHRETLFLLHWAKTDYEQKYHHYLGDSKK